MTISINDGKATPVAHVFEQDNTQNGKTPALFVNRSNPNGPGYWETATAVMTVGQKARRGEPATNAYAIRLIRPIEKVVNGVTVLRYQRAFVTILADSDASSVSETQDTVAMVSNLMANAAVKTDIANWAPLTA